MEDLRLENYTRWLPDTWLTLCYLLSSILSLVVLASISPERLGQQAIMFGIGFVLFIYLAHQDSAVFKTFAPILYLLSLIILIATIVLGDTVRGSTRWIPLGSFQLQGGEFVKPFLVLAFAFFLSNSHPRHSRIFLSI